MFTLLSFCESSAEIWQLVGKIINIIKIVIPIIIVILAMLDLGKAVMAGEEKEITLKLDIEKTDEARNYLQKVTAKGEVYQNVVYILGGKEYRKEKNFEERIAGLKSICIFVAEK